jgi:hypothetical protein
MAYYVVDRLKEKWAAFRKVEPENNEGISMKPVEILVADQR